MIVNCYEINTVWGQTICFSRFLRFKEKTEQTERSHICINYQVKQGFKKLDYLSFNINNHWFLTHSSLLYRSQVM